MEKGYVVIKGSRPLNEADAIKLRPLEGDVEILVRDLRHHKLIAPPKVIGEYISLINYLPERRSEVLTFINERDFDLYIPINQGLPSRK